MTTNINIPKKNTKQIYYSDDLSISGHTVYIPQGKIVNTGLTSTFTHNEFLVYDEGQVHMKYLLRVKWDHGGGFVF